MSYALIVAEVRNGAFEERNLDAVGLSNLMGKDAFIVMPDAAYAVNDKLFNTVVKIKTDEAVFLNPLNMTGILKASIDLIGKPDVIIFTHSSSGTELASYAAGHFNMPIITDVNWFDKERGVVYKSYYSDKIFGEFKQTADGPLLVTVRSGSFKEHAVEKASTPQYKTIENVDVDERRKFLEYVEEEKSDVDITKEEFLLSIGRGIGNKDEVADYEELAGLLKASLAGSRPVIDKMWLPKARQVGTSGKTVKPKVYFAMGISGAFQHIAGMKDSDCIIAVNKDPEAPIFQYAHYGVVADTNKVRDKLREIIKG